MAYYEITSRWYTVNKTLKTWFYISTSNGSLQTNVKTYKNLSQKPLCMSTIYLNRNNHFPCSYFSSVIDVIGKNKYKFHAEFREDMVQSLIWYKPKLNSTYNLRFRLQISNSVKIQLPVLYIKKRQPDMKYFSCTQYKTNEHSLSQTNEKLWMQKLINSNLLIKYSYVCNSIRDDRTLPYSGVYH
jgi:hypothetical protein